MKFGQVVMEQRRRLCISQRDLADRIKKESGEPISPQYLNDIEHDRRGAPSPYLMQQFADALELPLDYLQVVAGQMPEHLRQKSQEPAKIEKALQAYRKVIEA